MTSFSLRAVASLSGDRAWTILRILLAGILLSTAVVKTLFVRQLLSGEGLLSLPWVLPMAVGAEVGTALFLLFAPARGSYLTAVVTFSVLAMVSGWSLATGRDCGCFGPRTNTLGPFLLDLACLVALAFVRPRRRLNSQVRMQLRNLIAIAAASVAVALGMHAVSQQSVADSQGLPLFFGENLVGREWPLMSRVELAARSGGTERSLFVLLRPDCDHCREFARHWMKEPLPGWNPSQIFGIAVEDAKWTVMPGMISADPMQVEGATTLKWGAGREPFVATPAIFVVEDEIVSCILDGVPALDAVRRGLSKEAICRL